MEFKLLVKALADVGLDLSKATRIESLSGEQLIDYNPASDIVNLFPTLLAASINDLNSIEGSEHKVELFTSTLIDKLCADAFEYEDGIDFETNIIKTLKKIKKNYPEYYEKLTSKFFINALITFFVANKFGIRSCAEKMGGKGYLHYFALLDLFDDLEPETQDMIIKDLANKHLWDVTEEDIEEEDEI